METVCLNYDELKWFADLIKEEVSMPFSHRTVNQNQVRTRLIHVRAEADDWSNQYIVIVQVILGEHEKCVMIPIEARDVFLQTLHSARALLHDV